MPYESILLGMGVVFNILTWVQQFYPSPGAGVWWKWKTDFFTILSADASGRGKPVLVITFLENTREFPAIATSTGAKLW